MASRCLYYDDSMDSFRQKIRSALDYDCIFFQRVTADIMSHYLDKVFTAIANNEELEGLQSGLGE